MADIAQTQVKINGIDVTAYLRSYIVEKNYGDKVHSVGLVFIKKTSSLVTPVSGLSLQVWRGWASPTEKKVFDGIITNVETTGSNFNIQGKNKLVKTLTTEITYSYDSNIDPQAGVISEIFKDLVTQAGLSYSGTSIQNSGTILTLTKFICNHATIKDRMDALANALNWQYYFNDNDGYVYFEPKGFYSNAYVLQTGVNIIIPPKWNDDKDEMVNVLDIVGAVQEVETTESFNGDGVTKIFTITNVPNSTKVYVGGVLKYGGTAGSSATYDYVVDKTLKKISFTSAPGAGSGNVQINYSYYVPTPVRLKRPASIGTYEVHQKTLTLTDVTLVNDAIIRGNKMLDVFQNPFINTVLRAKKLSSAVVPLDVGNRVNVVDTINGKNVWVVITKYAMNYPCSYDELIVGDKELQTADVDANLADRLSALERQNLSSQQILTSLVGVGVNFRMRRKKITVTRTPINDSFILGHPINGILGNGTILFGMTNYANWSGSGLTLANETTTYRTNSVDVISMKCTWASSGSKNATSTNSLGDLSAYTGVSSGTPTKGCVGLWVYQININDISAITLRIGSSPSNYLTVTGVPYVSYVSLSTVSGWVYYTFPLISGTPTGTPNWTSVAHTYVSFTAGIGSGSIYLDYLTISKSNLIGLNGLGDRRGTGNTYFTTTYY